MNTCQITKRKLTKQPNKNLPNNQAKTYQTTKLLLNSLFVSEKRSSTSEAAKPSGTFAQKYYCMAEHFNYRKRVVDSLLAEKLEAMGAVLIEGPAWRHISRH